MLYILSRLPLLILPALLVGLTEFCNRGHVKATIKWVLQRPHEFALNYLLVFGLYFLFVALTSRMRTSYWIVTFILLTSSLVSGIKFKILGLPLLPWDIVLSSEGADVAQYAGDLLRWELVGGIAAFFLISYLVLHRVPRTARKSNWPERAVLLLLSAFLLYGTYTNKPFKFQNAFKISTIPWDQAENYLQNGFLLTSMLNMDLVFIPEPEGYTETAIENYIKDIPRRTNTDGAVKPNIIVMLSESFWDPTLMKDVRFSEDPLPFFHSLQQNYTSGTLLSPQFGGGTANVEFEVLSGNSIRFLPQGSLAYIQYVNHEVDSLASILDRQDYNTVSVNPFHNWFFDSNKVYKDFGFGKFISSEFFDSGVNGLYIPDTKVSEVIISEAQKSKGPDFIFANTMENHWPYEPWKFGNNNHFKVLNNYSEETKGIIETYAQGVHNAEQSLKMMVDHYTKTKEPTIIVFFGDHLPLLGNEYGVYKETKYLSENDPDFLNKMYSTPFVVWNNYLPEKKETLHINPSFLGPYVLNLAERKGSYYTDYLYALSKKMPIIPPNNHYQEMNIKEEDLTEYKLLQHDILFGSRYGYKEITEPIVHKDYMLGFGEMTIESVDSEVLASPDSEGESDTPVEVHGHFFVPGSTVYLGDKPLKTTFHDESHLTASIPKALMAKKGKKTLQVEVYDSKKIAIAKSNPFELAAK